MAQPSQQSKTVSQQRRSTLVGVHPTCTVTTMQELYESGDVIGTGSFGIIRKVTRRKDGVVVARKELNYGRMDERDLRQLTEEVNILEKLAQNDNIVRYYERFVDKPNNMLYIIMEYCEGGDLAGVIQRCRNGRTLLPEDLVWSYLTQLALALHDCHSELDLSGNRKPVILHRDLKPENVFLDRENNLKLGDFGLSKAMAQAAMTNTYVGTPYYMSPELINGHPYDVKSDIWALGCLIYELCAGHPPFHEARTQPELAKLIREGKIPDLPEAYSSTLGKIVLAMLKQSPKLRPNTQQLLKLDKVKLQRRVLELRKYHGALKARESQIQQRETELFHREQGLAQRERGVMQREQELAHQFAQLQMQIQQQSVVAMEMDRQQREREHSANLENEHPEEHHHQQAQPPRTAGRASMVPRRPLEERRASASFGQHPFPRSNSSSSLMSLDDTPVKAAPPASLRKRLASKSMQNISGAIQASAAGLGLRHGGINDSTSSAASGSWRDSRSFSSVHSHMVGGTPTSVSAGNISTLSAVPSSPTRSSNTSDSQAHSRQPSAPGSPTRGAGGSVMRKSDSAASPPRKSSLMSRDNSCPLPTSPSRAIHTTTSPNLRPPMPQAPMRQYTSPLPVTTSPMSDGMPSPAPSAPASLGSSPFFGNPSLPNPPAPVAQRSSPVQYENEDDVPSPFLKNGARFATSNAVTKAVGGAKVAAVAASAPAARTAPGRAPKASLGPRPSLASRLLATRAQAGTDEIGRRVSMTMPATIGHTRSGSTA